MRIVSEYTEEDANSFGDLDGPSGKRRDVMVNGCISQKRELLVEGFCSHVMHSAAFQI